MVLDESSVEVLMVVTLLIIVDAEGSSTAEQRIVHEDVTGIAVGI